MLPLGRAFRHRDFRLLWIGAFFSFTGSWIQNIAQGWLVYDLTRSEAKLAFVTFCGMAPVSIIGPFAGALADTFNKRKVLIIAQSAFGCGALFLMVATAYGFVQYWHIVAVALMFGIVGSFEMPARQSVLGRVVPPEDLAIAIPLNAMTFNSARLFGPAVGGILLASFGPQACYGINGFSYLALISAVVAIRADLTAVQREPQPIWDLLLEGMRYTFHDKRLKTLFIMEAIVSGCGLFYLSLMPAIATELLNLSKQGLGWAMATVGIGAITGLLTMTWLADRPYKSRIVRYSMVTMGLALLALGFSRSPWTAFPLIAIMGASTIMQFNTTNTLFQLLSPEHLRGRVLSMHIWAISGLGPFGMLFFGWFAGYSKVAHNLTIGGAEIALPTGGIPLALKLGGICVLAGALWGLSKRKDLKGVQ